jgi:hypothetical protein
VSIGDNVTGAVPATPDAELSALLVGETVAVA